MKKTLLIVDDDVDLLMLLERALTAEGFVVESACSLSEAEEFMQSHAPAVVLLDININGEDGRQLCWKIKKNAEYQPKVVVMSGYDCNMPRSLLFGADDFIAKPFQIEFLLLKLNQFYPESADTAAKSP